LGGLVGHTGVDPVSPG